MRGMSAEAEQRPVQSERLSQLVQCYHAVLLAGRIRYLGEKFFLGGGGRVGDEECGHPPRVDAEPSLTTTLRHELHNDPAVCALDEKLAELPEIFAWGELDLTLPDLDNLLCFVNEAVAAEQDFAADIVKEIGVFFHGGAHGSMGGWLLNEGGIDGVIDGRATPGLEADAGGRALDAADGIETGGQRGDAHDVGDAGALASGEGERSGHALILPRIVLQRCGEPEVEIGGDVLDTEHAAMASVPGGVVAAAVRVPQHGRGKMRGIFQGEPDELFVRENDGGPREIVRVLVVQHDEVLKSFARGVAGEIRLPAVDHGHVVEVVEPCALLERGVAALDGVFKRGRENLCEAQLARGDDARAVAGEVEHGVVSETHPAFEILQQVGLVKVGFVFAGFDYLGDLTRTDACPQQGDKASGFGGKHFPCGIGGLAVGRMRLATPRRPGTKRRTEEISPQFAEHRNELVGPGFVTPRSGGERLNDLSSETEFDRPELSAVAGDIKSHVHGIVELQNSLSALWSNGPEFEARR